MYRIFILALSFIFRFLPVKRFYSSRVSIPDGIKTFLDCSDLDKIEKNILLRKHNNNIPLIRQLLEKVNTGDKDGISELKKEALKLPNSTHPRLWNYGDEPKVLEQYALPKSFNSTVAEFSELSKYMNIFRMDHLGNYTGHKSYYLFGKLAEMEHAIKEYTVDQLRQNNFVLVSVPDILPKNVIEGCGMQTDGERTQVRT